MLSIQFLRSFLIISFISVNVSSARSQVPKTVVLEELTLEELQNGYPSVTLPMGFVEHLPVGISFFGTAWSEPLLIEIACGFENATKARRAPELLD